MRHQRRHAAAPGRRRRRRRASTPPARGSASTATTTPAAPSPTRWPRSTPAPPTCRAPSTATASAPATPTCSPSSPTSSSSRACRCWSRARLREATRIAHAISEVTNVPALQPPALRRAERVRAQGRPARQRHQGRPRPLPAHRPHARRQRHADAGLRHGRPRQHRAQGRGSSASTSAGDDELLARVLAGSRTSSCAATPSTRPTPRSSCCCGEELDGRLHDYFEVESWRVITDARGDESAPLGGDRQAASPAASGSSPPGRATARSTPSTTRCARRCRRPTPRSTSSS